MALKRLNLDGSPKITILEPKNYLFRPLMTILIKKRKSQDIISLWKLVTNNPDINRMNIYHMALFLKRKPSFHHSVNIACTLMELALATLDHQVLATASRMALGQKSNMEEDLLGMGLIMRQNTKG